MQPVCPVRIGSPAKLANRWLRQHPPFAVALGTLCFVVGCSNSSTIQSPGKAFTARLKGNYGFTLNGSYFSAAAGTQPYQEVGTIVADGEGNITGGTDDFVQNSVLSSGKITGTYAIGEDGTGGMILNMPRGQIQLGITLGSDSSLYLIEFDTFANGAGVAVQQTKSALTSTPSGTLIFHFHSSHSNNGALGSVSGVGRIQVSGGSISGVEDVVRAGVPDSSAVTGSLTAPDANGRGTATFTDDAGATHYIYYVDDSRTLRFLQTDPGILGGGRVEMQSDTTFSDASFHNGFAFSSSGETLNHLFGANSEGAFTADGNGNIVSGSYDAMQDGTPITNATLTGTYHLDSTGRATITLNPQGLSPFTQVAWMVNASRGFFLVNSRDRAEDGRLN